MKIHELGHIVLYVFNLTRSADFYKNVLGFEEIHRDAHTALYSSGRTHHELLIIEIGGEAKDISKGLQVGLYHIGFKIGSSNDELRSAIKDLTNANVQIVGSADHHVTHSIYILDPDNNELELYVDVDEAWKNDSKLILNRPARLNL